ncbi:zinc ribbon domain-containing protein [Nocardia sp. NPDC051990]|uniref:zinc ribbon domain-containing protein n=1 Tax=Nocardia sp. NPDC051990 TaxID=3155285 RepID=UPI003421A83F
MAGTRDHSAGARQRKRLAGWRFASIALDHWFPPSRFCSHCGTRKAELTAADRICARGCGHRRDRDHNAAVNLAAWSETVSLHLSVERDAVGLIG